MRAGDVVSLFRPWQWTKNGIVLAGLVFSLHLFDPAYVLRAFAAVAAFCLASSSVYVFNDLVDRERDRRHPVKRNRPLASGRVSPAQARWLLLVPAILSLLLGVRLGHAFFVCLVLFFAVNLAYSLVLKNLVILDVLLIAVSFVLRAIAGVTALQPLAPSIEISPWLLICTLFLALFLGFAKRRHELTLLQAGAAGHRTSLGDYSEPLLDQLMSIVTGATLIAYAIYTIAPSTQSKFHFHFPDLVITIPFVVYGVFRYLFLVQKRDQGGNPSRTLYRDPALLITTAAWLVTVVVVVYAGRA